jgi:hypothetical protein
MRCGFVVGSLLAFGSLGLAGGTSCKSGLAAGKRPGPYSSLVATGEHRGTQHCFICEAGDRPVVIVFARAQSDALGRLLHQIDRALAELRKSELRAWATFLSNDQPGLDPQLVNFSKKHAIGNIPLAVFEDAGGPPSYRLAGEAEVTVMVSVKQRVVANFAYRAGELNDAAIAQVMRSVRDVAASEK